MHKTLEGQTQSTKPDNTNCKNTEYSTNGSTGQRVKAPAEPVLPYPASNL